jgi:hypothetical protein
MNPATLENPAGASAISPSYSPLHPPSVQHNVLILTNLCTLTSVFSGTLAGILGLLNLNGFFLYFFASLFNAGTIALLKCRNERTGKVELERFLPSLHDVNEGLKGWRLTVKALWNLMAVGQENLLTFLLFWIGFYVRTEIGSFFFSKLTPFCRPDRPSYTVRPRFTPCSPTIPRTDTPLSFTTVYD